MTLARSITERAELAAHEREVLHRYPQIGRLTRKGRPAFYMFTRSVYHESRNIDTLVQLIEGKTA